MSTRRDEHLDDVLCHCHGIEHASGHPLGTAGCEADVKAGTYTPFSAGHTHRDSTGRQRNAHMAAGIYAELARHATCRADRDPYQRRAAIARTSRDVHKRYVGP